MEYFRALLGNQDADETLTLLVGVNRHCVRQALGLQGTPWAGTYDAVASSTFADWLPDTPDFPSQTTACTLPV